MSRLVGAPPGYVGYEEGGQLTEAVRRRPYAVVLLDEIEKAHPEVFNILLQMLDDGRLTDNQGRTTDFKNAIVIMTSNLGSEVIRDRMEAFEDGLGSAEQESIKNEILELLKKRLRPEFLNRIDEIVMFRARGRDQIREIVEIQFARIQSLVMRSHGINLQMTDDAKDWLASQGFDPVFGARPLKRVLQRQLTNKLAEEILGGWLADGSEVRADRAPDDTGLVFEILREEELTDA